MKRKKQKKIAINSPKPHKEPIAADYLKVRKKPILIIYPLALNPSNDQEKKIADKFNNEKVVIGFAIGFPGSDNKLMVKYRANARKLKELSGDIEEEEEEEVYGEE